jgi:hypothetical protein
MYTIGGLDRQSLMDNPKNSVDVRQPQQAFAAADSNKIHHVPLTLNPQH